MGGKVSDVDNRSDDTAEIAEEYAVEADAAGWQP
jgi:hypothetical protein